MMRMAKSLLMALAVGLAMPALAAGFKLEVLQLPADPPGHVREAPGGGRVLASGLLYTPATGANVHGPAIVMLDSGPGAHPLEAGQATRFAAERLAARGYTVLSLYGFQERGYPLIAFPDNIWSIKAAFDYLEMNGYEDFVLAGQSYGAIAAAQYLATQPDQLLDNGGEKRVKAVVLINPLTDVRAFPRIAFGPQGYDAKVAAARASVASGRGLYPTNLEPGQGASTATDPWIAAGAFAQPAEAFLAYWGPEAQARNMALLGRITVPGVALISGGDHATSASVKTGSSLDIVRFDTDAGRFTGAEDAASNAIATWLASHGLGIRPKVTVTTLDVTTGGGRILQGVEYATGNDRHKPVILLLSGRAADSIQSSTHWIGWRLAQQGYTVIAPGMRISGATGFNSSTLAEVKEDVGHWVDKAQALGWQRVVLAGHSNGGIWLSNYIAKTQDKRVVGTIYIAPTRDSPSYARDHEPPGRYDAEVAEARAAVADGRGMDDVIGLMSAQAFLDNNGPDADTVHTARVREFSLPGLSITGNRDGLMTPDFVKDFSAAYKGKLDTIRYDNGTHGLRENKDRLAADVANWMRKRFP